MYQNTTMRVHGAGIKIYYVLSWNYIAPVAMCYNPPPVRDKTLGTPVKLVYCLLTPGTFPCMSAANTQKFLVLLQESVIRTYFLRLAPVVRRNGIICFCYVMLLNLVGSLRDACPKLQVLLLWLISPSAAFMRQRIRSALVQIMACRLFGAKPSSKPMPGYFQWDP